MGTDHSAAQLAPWPWVMPTASSGWAEQLRQQIQGTALQSISSPESCRQRHSCVRKPGKTRPGTQGADVEAISWGQIPPVPAGATGRVPVLQAWSLPGHSPPHSRRCCPWQAAVELSSRLPVPAARPHWSTSSLVDVTPQQQLPAATPAGREVSSRLVWQCSPSVALGWLGEEWSSQWKLSGVT